MKYAVLMLFPMLLLGSGRLEQDDYGDYVDHKSLRDSLVAHYKMNDNAASTTVVDSMGYSNGTAQQNTDQITTTGKVKGALTFNGSSDYVNTNNTFQSTFQDSFSVNLWCKPNDGQPVGYKTILGIQDAGHYPTDHFNISIRPNGFLGGDGQVAIVYQAKGNELSIDSLVFSNGEQSWTMITAVFEKLTPTTAKALLYVNSVLIETKIMGYSVVMSDYISAVELCVGVLKRDISPPLYYFDGPIDNVMIFNKALNLTEIKYLYKRGKGREKIASSIRRSR